MTVASKLLLEDLFLEVEKPKSSLDAVPGIHKYWARKPWHVLEWHINQFSKKGDLIFDPFMGSGAVGLQANLLGRRFIGNDLNPMALRISTATLDHEFDYASFDNEFEALKAHVKRKIMDIYRDGSEYALWTRQEGNQRIGVFSDFEFGNRRRRLASESNDSVEGEAPSHFIKHTFPKDFYKDRFSYKGIHRVSELFSEKNLVALGILSQGIEMTSESSRSFFSLALSNSLLHFSKLKSENIRPLGVNNFWIPDDHIEENVWWRFEDRVKKLRKAKLGILNSFREYHDSINDYSLYLGDATDFPQLEDSTVDYILTDPPYGEAIQYSELSYVWNSWFDQTYVSEKEVIQNPKQGKGRNEYVNLLEMSIREMTRVLKPEGKVTMAFHAKDLQIWISLAEKARDAGLKLERMNTQSTKGNPFTQNWAKFSPKSDFYLTFSKSPGATIHNELNFQDLIQDIRPRLGHLNIGQAYDLVVANVFLLISSGVNLVNTPRNIDMRKVLVEEH